MVLCSSLPSLDHVLPFVQSGLALVAFDRTAQAGDPPSLANVSVDNVVGTALATRHLLELGHRRLAFVSGSLRSVNRAERFRGFTEALAAAGLDTGNDALVWSGGPDDAWRDRDVAELGRAAAYELMPTASPPTAIVAINDMCALGVCAGIRDNGRDVSRDVFVVGFDDILLADLAAPPLTTVSQPLADMAAAAFALLRDQIEGPPSRHPAAPCSFAPNSSSAPPSVRQGPHTQSPNSLAGGRRWSVRHG